MKNKLSNYIHIYTHRFQVYELYYPHFPKEDLCLSIVIPSFKEPDILSTLDSLKKCRPPRGTVEVIVVINAPEDGPQEYLQTNELTFCQIQNWIEDEKPDFIEVLVIREENLPIKHAGAGWARKIGMDEAAQRWGLLDLDGPILCLDADCTVSEDYLIAAEEIFADWDVKVAHYNFDHPYQLEQDPVLQEGVILYELHLRCYIQGLKSAGYSFAVHTLGSCMAVRASSYVRAGGMNRRKAGEDFHFIHKLLPTGGWRNIPATVYPSCRISDRVPFGTGRAQTQWHKQPLVFQSYHPKIYSTMKPLFSSVSEYYHAGMDKVHFSPLMWNFLIQADLVDRIQELRIHSKTMNVFLGRFWQLMDGLMVLKLTHYLRDHAFPDVSVLQVAREMLENPSITAAQALEQFRKMDGGN